MPVIWWKLITVFLLFALFTTIVCINSEISKRREAEAEAAAAQHNASSHNMTPFISDSLWNIMRNETLEQAPKPAEKEMLPAEVIDARVRAIFQVREGEGVVIFNNSQQQPQLTRPEPATQPRRPPNDNIVFPDSIGKYRPSTLNQCADGFNQSRSFCTNVNNYPDLSGVKSILSRNFANFFINEQVDQPDIQALNTRLGISTDEQYLCKSHVRILYPKLGQKLDSSWQLIVNTDEFKQGILIEECDNEGSPCDFLDSFPNNYKPVCKQHYVVRHLVTINNATLGQPEVANEPFKIPSCCKCVVKSSFSANIGA
ncbi:protein spaetzle isoform X3 [Drosophila busckii]|uniref:protein spaetzle isoform X3 n=1 Tax=Drosophila busckii TaxID=30019 RepID=UPI00083E9E35|nr:protein spaetzle isoform X3 [Drosophila busckii]